MMCYQSYGGIKSLPTYPGIGRDYCELMVNILTVLALANFSKVI